MIIAACVGGLACMLACNKEEVGAYTPLPKIHLGETFKYKCEPENYIRLEYPDFVNVSPKIHQQTMAQCVDGVSSA